MSGPVIFATNQTCTENGHSNWPKYFDQHCSVKFNLHFPSFITIWISENGLTLDPNPIKKSKQSCKLLKFNFWPKLNMWNICYRQLPNPKLATTLLLYIYIKCLGKTLKLLLRY